MGVREVTWARAAPVSRTWLVVEMGLPRASLVVFSVALMIVHRVLTCSREGCF